jgi:hypothetical protein
LTSILTNKLLKFGYSVGHVEVMGLPVWWSSLMEVQPAWNRACHSYTYVQVMFFPLNASLNNARVSVAPFPRCTKFDIHALFLCQIHCEIVSG